MGGGYSMKYNPDYMYCINDDILKDLLVDIEIDMKNVFVALYLYAHTGNLQNACFGLKTHELEVINRILACSPDTGEEQIVLNNEN